VTVTLVSLFVFMWLFINRSASLCNMQCMLQTAPNVLVMGGHQPLLVSFDLETRQEIQQVAECCSFITIIITAAVCIAPPTALDDSASEAEKS